MSWLLKIKRFFSDTRPALLRPVSKDLVLAIDGVENVLLMNAARTETVLRLQLCGLIVFRGDIEVARFVCKKHMLTVCSVDFPDIAPIPCEGFETAINAFEDFGLKWVDV